MKTSRISRIHAVVSRNLSLKTGAIKEKGIGIFVFLLLLSLNQVMPREAMGGGFRELKQEEGYPAADDFWISPFVGAVFYGGLKPLPNTGFYEDLHRPTGFLIGIRASRRVSRFIRVEASISKSSTENVHQLLYVDPNHAENNPPYGIQTLRNSINPVLRIGGNVLLLPLPRGGPIIPHLSAGVGWTHLSPRREVEAIITVPIEDGSVFVDTTEVTPDSVKVGSQDWLSIDLGGGLSGKVTQVLAVRLDLIMHLSKFSQLDVGGPLTGEVFYGGTQWVVDLELSSGVVFRF